MIGSSADLSPESILAKLIRINTTNPPGQEIGLACYLKELFDSHGIPSQIIEAEPGRASFVATIGSGEKAILFLSHTDVVPPGEGWDFDPLGGEVRSGMVLGRGALDCKSLVAAEAWALLQLHQQGGLNGRLTFIAAADEERGGKLGVEFLVTNYPDLFRVDFAINEGAEEPIVLNQYPLYFIQIGEKGMAQTKLVAKGISCHGSVPSLGENAVVKMAHAVTRLADYHPQPVIIPEVSSLLQELANELGFSEGDPYEMLSRILHLLPDHNLREDIRALTRMTISPNVINGGLKANIVPDHCTAEVDIRVLPGQDQHYVMKILEQLLRNTVEFHIPNYQAPTLSPYRSPYYQTLVQTLTDIVQRLAPSRPKRVGCVPWISTGGTDSRFLRRIDIPAYGIAVMAPDFPPEIRSTVHGKNERIDISSLRLMARFLVALARNYLK